MQDTVGAQITLDLSPPNITVSSPTSLENQISVITTLSEAGTVRFSVDAVTCSANWRDLESQRENGKGERTVPAVYDIKHMQEAL